MSIFASTTFVLDTSYLYIHGNKYLSRLRVSWRRFSKLHVSICGVPRDIMSLNIETQQGKVFFFSNWFIDGLIRFFTPSVAISMCLNVTTSMGRPWCQIITMLIFSMTYTEHLRAKNEITNCGPR